jgi:ATP-binding cassette subfamily B protein
METYKRLFAYAPEKKAFGFAAIFLSAAAAVVGMLPFWYLWKFLLAVAVRKETALALQFAFVIVGLLVSYLVIYMTAVLSSHFMAFRLESNLRKAGTDALLQASFSFFDAHSSGHVRKIVDNNAAQTHMVVAHLLPDITGAVIAPLMMFILVFMVDIMLGFVLLGVVVVAMILTKAMYGDKNFMERYQKALEKVNSEAVEYVRGMQVIKIFKTTIESYKSFYKAVKDYGDLAYQYSLSCQVWFVIYQVFLKLIVALIIPLFIVFINRGADPALILIKLIFFTCVEGMIYSALIKTMYVGMYQFQAKAALDKLEELFTKMKEKKPTFGTETVFENSNIEFRNVSFKYEENFILKDLTFKLDEGKAYAFVGSSGGGKSTLAKLISGFYGLDGGEILIGGKPLTSYSEKAITEQIGFVFQNAKLFNKMSIYENVALAKPGATREEVAQAIKDAQAVDILDKFPDRENTIIGSTGVYLSGGEVQRIAIARIFLKNPAIIILDEASAAADPENEYEIQKAFASLMKGRTVIMIAHRLTSIQKVDEALVIEDGKILERGSHAALMAKESRYSEFQNLYAQANDWRVS